MIAQPFVPVRLRRPRRRAPSLLRAGILAFGLPACLAAPPILAAPHAQTRSVAGGPADRRRNVFLIKVSGWLNL